MLWTDGYLVLQRNFLVRILYSLKAPFPYGKLLSLIHLMQMHATFYLQIKQGKLEKENQVGKLIIIEIQ